jgi:peroxiredoxin Q/BCP
MAPLEPGKKAPAFKLPTTGGKTVALGDFKDQFLVLYFYPKDDTPGCTIEAHDFQKALPALKKLGAVVLGVSKDSVESHARFAKKYGLKFPLLSDKDGKVIDKYGAWGEKNNYGKKYMGILRSTVIIDPKGKVARVFEKVKVKGHVDAVLDAIRELKAS